MGAESQSAAIWSTSKCAGWLLAVAISLFGPSTAVLAQFGQVSNGQPLRQLAPPGTRAVALFFVASNCPISDRTFPEMKRLREQFSSQGVKFYFVYPNSTEHLADVTAHQQAFDPGGEILVDPAGELVRLTHARVTPEVSVLVRDERGFQTVPLEMWRSVYTGRIDDRYIHLGLERPRPTHVFAEEALTAVLSGKVAPKPTGTPVGCAIVNPAINGVSASR